VLTSAGRCAPVNNVPAPRVGTLLVMKNDLKTVSVYNVMHKYDNDIYVLVPEHTDTHLSVEFSHIRQWASINKMKFFKSKEIVFRRPCPTRFSHHLLMVLSRLNCLNASVLFSSIV